MCFSGMSGGGSAPAPALDTGSPLPAQPAPAIGQPAQAGSPLLQDTGGVVRADPLAASIWSGKRLAALLSRNGGEAAGGQAPGGGPGPDTSSGGNVSGIY